MLNLTWFTISTNPDVTLLFRPVQEFLSQQVRPRMFFGSQLKWITKVWHVFGVPVLPKLRFINQSLRLGGGTSISQPGGTNLKDWQTIVSIHFLLRDQ